MYSLIFKFYRVYLIGIVQAWQSLFAAKLELATSTMPSMWRKTREKAQAKTSHTANFTSGHVPVHEYHLSRVGLRGRKRLLCFSLLVLLYLAVLGNLVLTALILSVLKFTPFGLPYMIFGSSGDVVFTQPARLQHVHVADTMQGFIDHNLHISSAENMVSFHAGPQRQVIGGERIHNSSQILLQQSAVTLQPFDSLKVMSSDKHLLSLSQSLSTFPTLKTAQGLSTPITTTNKLSGSSNLTMSGSYMIMLGDTGLNITSQQVTLAAQSVIRINGAGTVSTRGTIVLESPERHVINTTVTGSSGYHLCVCSNGRLFRVPTNPSGCLIANNFSPCR